MKMGILVLICMTIIGWCNISLCATSKENNIKSEAEKYAKDIDLNNINKEDILNAYEEISQEYTNEELRQVIINMLYMFEEITIKGDNQNE